MSMRPAALFALVLATSAALPAHAEVPPPPAPPIATFAEISDAVPGRWIDAATTAPSAANPNRLVFGFSTGSDPRSFRTNAFIASTTAFHYPNVMDTLRFVVSAPAGYYVSKVNYAQRGTATVSRIGKAAGGAQWVVGDTAADLGFFGTNGALTGSMDLTERFQAVVPVSITIGMHAFAAPSVGASTISISAAEVDVELLPLPSTLLLGR